MSAASQSYLFGVVVAGVLLRPRRPAAEEGVQVPEEAE